MIAAYLFLLLAIAPYVSLGTLRGSTNDEASRNQYLGLSFSISELNLIDWDTWIGKPEDPVFSGSLPDQSISVSKHPKQVSDVEFYKTTKEFSQQFELSADGNIGVAAEQYSAKATLEHTLKQYSDTEVEHHSSVFQASNFLEEHTFDPGSLSRSSFSTSMLAMFEALPVNDFNTRDLSETETWIDYKRFLDRFGSHVVSTIRLGAFLRILHVETLSSSESDEQTNNKACLSAQAYGINAQGCESTSKNKEDDSSHDSKSDRILTYGGTTTTATQVSTPSTDTDQNHRALQDFLNSASSNTVAQIGFMGVWEVLRRFYRKQADSSTQQDHMRRVEQLEAYFNVFLAQFYDQPAPDGTCFEILIDYKGSDVRGSEGSVSADNPQDCQRKCQSLQGCKAFTFYHGNTCYLKDGVSRRQANTACVSGPKECGTKKDTGYQLVYDDYEYKVLACEYPSSSDRGSQDCDKCFGMEEMRFTAKDNHCCFNPHVTFEVCHASSEPSFFREYNPVCPGCGVTLENTDNDSVVVVKGRE